MVETYVCTVAGGKGGVGKSTTAINVATALAQDGYEVALVDGDLVMANIGRMLSLDTDATIHEVLTGDRQVADAFTMISEGVRVLPGNPTLRAYSRADPSKIQDVIGTLRGAFEIVILDTNSSVDSSTARGLAVADGVVLVSKPTELSLHNTRQTERLCARLGSDVLGVVFAQVDQDRSTDQIRDLIDRTDGALDVPVLGAIPTYEDTTVDHPVVVTDASSPVAEAYQRLANALAAVFLDGVDPESVPLLPDEFWFEETASAEVASGVSGSDDPESGGFFDGSDDGDDGENDGDDEGLLL